MGHSVIDFATAIVKCLHKVRSGHFKGVGLTVTHQISILSHSVKLGSPKTKIVDHIYIQDMLALHKAL